MSSSRRNEKINKAKFRKKIREWKYLKEEEKDVSELHSIYSSELTDVITKLSNIFPDSAPNSEVPHEEDNTTHYSGADFSNPEVPGSSKNSDDTPEWIKKLYKKIAKETHPDIVDKMDISDFEKSIREGMFKKTSESIEQKKYDTLLEYAYDLDIEVNEDLLLDSGIIDKSVEDLKKSIVIKTNEPCWKWGEFEGDIDKRCRLISWLRSEMNLKEISIGDIRKFIESYENNSGV